MKFGHKLIFFLLIFVVNQISWAQEVPKTSDSTKLYRDIQKYSNKRKFTKFIYKFIFEPITVQQIKKNTFQKIEKKKYGKFQGKIIRKINITTLEPFGYSDIDSTLRPVKFYEKAGNVLHAKTKEFAVKNVILIKENQPLDSLLVKESERLIRAQRFVSSISIITQLTDKQSDSVDVFIRVLDSWTIYPGFSTSTSKSNLELNERSFLGSGHEFNVNYTKSLTTSQDAYGINYIIPSFKNTFIKTTINYQIDLDKNYIQYINFERPFYSPFARWAAGIYSDRQFRQDFITSPDNIVTSQNFKSTSQDIWAGHSYQLFKGDSEAARTTNFITAARYFNKYYSENPILQGDSLGIYTNEKLFLLGIGVSSRKFTQDRYIFNFNVIEDISSGIIYNITGGYQTKNNIGRYYFGARFSLGKYYKFGYLSTNIEYGTFFRDSNTVQSGIVFKTIYFTNLLETGRWKFRQFIKPEISIGNNRFNSDTDQLTLNGDKGIPGFDSTNLFGTKKIVVNFQTQGYSPWKLIGFRLNPFLNASFGALGDKENGFSNSKIYAAFGLGLIISNDYLVFSAFQVSFSFYPSIPGVGESLFKTNSIKTYDIGLPRFDLNKPNVVPYQ